MPQKILVVDDETDVRELLSTFLSDCGYEVLTARNAREGLEHIEKSMPGFVLLDMHLPDASGEDLLKYLRHRERVQGRNKIPVVVISGVLTQHLVPRLIKEGADGIIVKPFELQRVLKEVERVFDMGQHSTGPERERKRTLKDILENPTIDDIPILISRHKEIRADIDRLNGELDAYSPDTDLGVHSGDEDPAAVEEYARKLHALDNALEWKIQRKRLQKENQVVMATIKKIEANIQERMRGLSEDEEKPD